MATNVEHVSIVLGDRLCPGCGYNLNGESIVREPIYRMLIARCPKCNQVAPIQEYPPLGRWVSRWTMLVAGIWLLLLVNILLGGLTAVVVSGIGSVWGATEPLERQIGSFFENWWQESGEPDARLTSEDHFRRFWSENGPTVLEGRDGWTAYVEWDEAPLTLIPAGIAFAVGIFCSLALLHRRLGAMLLSAWILVMILMLLFGVAWILIKQITPLSPDHVAWVHMRMPMLAVVLLTAAVLFLMGLILGRPIVRGLVRAFLPLRLRGSLALLWTADGRTPTWPRSRSERT